MSELNESSSLLEQQTETLDKASKLMESFISGTAQLGDDRRKYSTSYIDAQITAQNSDNMFVQKMTGLTSTNEATSTTKPNAGAYNTMRNMDGESIYQSAVNAATSTYQDSDYAHGKRELQHIGALMGIDMSLRMSQDLHVATKIFGDRDVKSDGYHFSRVGDHTNHARFHVDKTFGEGSYRVVGNMTGNMLNDYRTNMNLLDNFLAQHNINGQNLSLSEIERALHSGKLGNIDLTTRDGIAIREVLEEKGFLMKNAGLVRQAGSFGGIRTLAKTWGREAMQDTDAYRGFRTVSSVYKGAVAGGWALKGSAGLAGNLLVSTTSGVAQAGTLVVRGGASAIGKVQKFKVLPRGLQTLDTKKVISSARDAQAGIKVLSGKGHSKINTAVQTNTKGVIKLAWNKTLGRPVNNFMKRFDPIRARFANAKLAVAKFTKPIRAPFTFVAWAKRMLTGVILIVAAMILLTCAMGAGFMAILSCTQGASDINITSIENGGIETSIGQELIDYLWNYQQAYEELLRFGETNVANHSGDCIPGAWNLSSSAVTVPMYVIDGNGNVTYTQVADDTNSLADYTIYSGGRVKGYDLEDYDGPSTCAYKASVYHFHEEISYVETEIEVENEDGTISIETEVEEIHEWVRDDYPTTEYFIGYAGADGTDESGNPLVVSDYDISASKGHNSTVDVTFNYEGSNYSYQYTLDKGSRYKTSEGKRTTYGINPLYKAITACTATIFGGDNSDLNAYKSYGKTLFDKVMNSAQATAVVEYVQDASQTVTFYYVDPDDPDHNEQLVSIPGYKAVVKINVYLTSTGLADVMNLDPYTDATIHQIGANTEFYKVQDSSKPGYMLWKGWDSTSEDLSAREQAVFYYEWDDTDWTNFTGYKFPTETADILSEEEIDDIIEQIRTNNGGVLAANRETLIRAALGDVGRFYYKYGGGHPITDLENPPGGLDCSGWMSYVLYMGGVDATYNARGASTLATSYRGVSFNGNFGALQPGTIIVKNADAGSVTTSTNHVVLFIGYAQLANDTDIRPYFVECTTVGTDDGRRTSGVMLTPKYRVNVIKNYNYARDPF